MLVHRPLATDRLKLLVFDLDGTLIDSRIDLANSVNAMLKQFGRQELPMEVIASYVGDGAPTLVRRALGDPDDERFFADALNYFLAWYREHKLDYTHIYDGIPEMLEAVQFHRGNGSQQRTLAVLTNKPVNPSRAIVQALHLNNFFFQVYGGNSFHTKKPDPFGLRSLMDEVGATAEETVMIGDSDIDILTARNAATFSVGVQYGFAPHTLDAAPPDVLVATPAELAQVLA